MRNLMIGLLLVVVGSGFAQDFTWSEPEVIETEHEGRYYDMFVDSENRVWLAWYGGYVTVKYNEDSVWSETDTLWRDCDILFGNPTFGESQDGKIWLFVEDNTTESSFVRGAFFDGHSCIDSFIFNLPGPTSSLKQEAIKDTYGRIVLLLPMYYFYWNFSEWYGPYYAYPDYPIDVVVDSLNQISVYTDIFGGFPNSVKRTFVYVGIDTVCPSETVIQHSHVDEFYSSFKVAKDGKIFLADGMDIYLMDRCYVRALYKNGTTIDSVVLDSSSASPSTERQIRNTCPITQDSLGRYWFSWKIEKWGPDDSAYIAIYDTTTHSIDTIFGIADSTIYGMITDNIGRIWILLGADDRLMVKHTLNLVGISEEKPEKPDILSLSASPNPFNSSVRIAVEGECDSPVQIEIYDVAGRRVETLRPSATSLEKGGTDDVAPLNKGGQGGSYVWQPASSLPSGIYLVRARFGEQSVSKRVVYLK